MKNITINELENLDNKDLPVMLENKFIVISYDEYIKTLKKIDPKKVVEIENAILEYQRNYYLSLFTTEIITNLKIELLKTFKQSTEEDFKNEVAINGMISTMGYYNCLKTILKEQPFEEEFFNWYDKLEYYDSDNFDSYIQEKLLNLSKEGI